MKLVLAFLVGLVATAIGLVFYCVIPWVTGLISPYFAVPLAILVGISIRLLARSWDPLAGIIAALYTIAGSLLGTFVSEVGYTAHERELPIQTIIGNLDRSDIVTLLSMRASATLLGAVLASAALAYLLAKEMDPEKKKAKADAKAKAKAEADKRKNR